MALINFSLPIIPSFIKTEPDKLIDVKLFDGSITQQLLFIPDIKVLVDFAKGDLGIADGIMKKMIFSNLTKIKDPAVLEQFLKSTGGSLPKSVSNYFPNQIPGVTASIPNIPKKPQFNPSEISISEIPGNLGGLKALEKSMIQSIFETQKPYMEIFKLVIENLVKIEDIIARVLAISGSSMNPKNNPKALGYEGNTDLNLKMSQLDGLTKLETQPKGASNTTEDSTAESNTEDPNTKGGVFITQSIVYSTGEFDPNVEYTYVYEYVREQDFNPVGTFSIPPPTGDEHLPQNIIFTVFNSNFEVIDESLITTPVEEARVNGTISKNINWINRSGKWFGRFEQIRENFDFQYQKAFGNILYYGDEGPAVKIGEETKFIKKGFPKIRSLTNLVNYYNSYYLDEARRRSSLKGLSSSQIETVVSEINSRLSSEDSFGSSGIQSTIEASLQNGFFNLSEGKTPGLPGLNDKKFPFKPKKIEFNGSQVWVDPEAKYDLKIIKCDSTTDITFLDIEPDNQQFKTTKIIRFVKDVFSIKMNDDSEFYYEILDGNLNNTIPSSAITREISIDNTRGGFFGSIFLQPITGTLNIYARYMDPAYREGIIFTRGDKHYRLSRFFDTWKIEQIYWSIDSSKREGNIISLGVNYLTQETGLDGIRRIKIKFPNGIDYYFSVTDGQLLYRAVYMNVSIGSVQPNLYERVQITINLDTLSSSREVFPIPPNSIRVEDSRYRFGKLISNTQILNNQLAQNKPFSTGSYGTPVGDKTQSIEQIYRFKQTEDDTETYYIIEGILSSNNNQKLNVPATSAGASSQSGAGDYSFPDLIGVIPVFIEMLIDVFAKLIPNITSLINLISNPPKFVTDIIIAKIGDNGGTEPEKFGIFSKKFIDELKKLSKITEGGITSSVDSVQNLDKRKKLENFVKNSKLNNYVYITPDGVPKFLLDGVATIKLFGDAPMLEKLPSISFGLETNLTNLAIGNLIPPINYNLGNIIGKPQSTFSQLTGVSKSLGESVNGAIENTNIGNIVSNITNPLGNIANLSPFKLIFQYFAPTSNLSLSELSGLTKINEQQKPSALSNSNFNPVLDIPNELLTKIDNNNFVYQIVDIQYSTGNKLDNINYKYIYIYQDLQKKILEAQKLDESGDTPAALALLEEAQKTDPNNSVLKDLLDELKKKLSNFMQPIIQFLLNLVTLPLKVIFGIISYIMDVFKSFLNPFELPGKIIDFVSFKWMLDFFNPTSKNSIFSIIGMKFDIETLLTVFVPGLISGFQQNFDLSKIIDMPFFAGKLPNYTKEQFDVFFNLRNGLPSINLPNIPAFPKLPSIPTLLLSSILCFIEAIINSIIDFIWAILGLGSLIPAPHLKLCRDSNQNLNPNDIADLLNGNFKDPSKDTGLAGATGPSYNFIFNVKTSDGRDIRGLDREELDRWLSENGDLEVNFNF